MSKLEVIDKLERFEVRITKEFKNETSYTKIEHVKDTILRKEWYNVVWHNYPSYGELIKNYFKYMYMLKSKSYAKEKDAIEHFNKIIKSKLK